MSKIQNIAEAKINVYTGLIEDFEKQIKDYHNIIEKQTYIEKHNYPLIYETLNKYVTILQNTYSQGNITEEKAKEGHTHVKNIENLFVEHQNNLKTSIQNVTGKIQATKAHKERIVRLLKREKQQLKHILAGNIDENGTYIGPPAQRPAGVRPADPMLSRKQNNK